MYGTPFKFELNRKLFHLLSSVLPLVYYFIPRMSMSIILMLTTTIILYIDIYRHYNTKIKVVVDKFFSSIMRDNESSGLFHLSGASHFFLGMFLVVLLFPKGLAITSILVLIVADTFAALIGVQFGKPLLNVNGKTIAGATAFMVSAVIISVFSYFLIGFSTTFQIIIQYSSTKAYNLIVYILNGESHSGIK